LKEYRNRYVLLQHCGKSRALANKQEEIYYNLHAGKCETESDENMTLDLMHNKSFQHWWLYRRGLTWFLSQRQ